LRVGAAVDGGSGIHSFPLLKLEIPMKRFWLLAWLTVASLAVAWLSGAGRLRAQEAVQASDRPAAKSANANGKLELPHQAERDGPKFIRIRRDDKGKPLAMETAVVRYTSPDRPGVAVDLVGAIHIADKPYYDELNKLFESYEVVLYELVAPEGTRIPKEGRPGNSAHPIGAMQNGMGAMLELEHQLDCVDYTKQNFVHADMSPDDFTKSMEKRGESVMQMLLRMMGQGMVQQAAQQQKEGSGSSDLGLLMALFSKDRAFKLKTLLADQFENMESQMLLFDGPDGSTIITERNKKALEVLDRQLKDGKKHVAVFYGAGHLPDMEKRLGADFGLKREGEKWLTAWSLEKKK
jgi:hypothetical protein